MEEKQLMDVIERFISLCDDLLKNGSITETQYVEMTCRKKEFLKSIA
ncbi:hypothetical protein HNQ80_003203 [Anaerosolibacter carboniphilus]|uniref:Uncharacterized protein n=1 Tax=Anaerosolibacter carboniphilus TaxID=1417629 RepID=A0A841KUM7_9FIRM|nr:hypothetical protein [Anaerosolibacter carboniphilus]MBB6217097.1 hypothetical protein [Anaerosolibacter carboniphilus]